MPYRPSERQYRDFAVDSFQPEVRESSDDQEQSYSVRGYFCTFREPYQLFPDYYEEIDPNAFEGCDVSDVLMQVNHEGHVYARNRNGSLQITTDDHGGHCVADLSGSKRGREELYEAISNGLIDRMSFGFTIADDGLEWEEDEQGVIHTRITKISKLYDVSAIAGFPANPGTEISARSLHDAIIEARDKKAEQESQAEDPEEVEQRSAETDEVSEPVMAETEAFGIDIDAIVDQVMERMSQQPAEAPEDVPDEPEVTHEEAEQALEDTERGTQAERRRRRRMRALQLINI